MALAFRPDDGGSVCVTADFPFAADATHAYFLVLENVRIPLGPCTRDGDTVRVQNRGLIFERTVARARGRDVRFQVERSDRAFDEFTERLDFHPSFFAEFFDFAHLPRDPAYLDIPDSRPELLAVFTHVYNDLEFLPLWERHYANLVPHRHLYVIDHGSTLPVADRLHRDTNVTTIPRGHTNHRNISKFCAFFQRFLLTQYAWVVHVDADELLIHRGGPDRLLARLADPAYGPIVRPAHALDLLDHAEGLDPIATNRPISAQRYLTAENPDYRKPVLASRRATWGGGFHYVYECASCVEDDDLWLVHLRYVDLALAARREQAVWIDVPQSAFDRLYVSQTRRSASLQALSARMNEDCAARRSTVPAWMRGAF